MISFRPQLIPEVFNGGKTVTRRSASSHFKAEQEHAICPGRGRPSMGRLRIVDVRDVRLGDMSDKDALEEGFVNFAAFREYWIELHKTWDSEKIVKRIEFEVIEQTHKLCGCCDGAGVEELRRA